MQIQVHTDHNIDGTERVAAHFRSMVENALGRFEDHVTRVEVHLSDTNTSKNGRDDKRCVMEARLEGRHPTAVTHEAATVEQAVHGAVDKLKRTLESTIERIHSHH